MKCISFVSMFFRPLILRETAEDRAESAAVIVNAVNGLFVVAALSLSMLPLFTPALVALKTILFGPLVGFTISSLYARVEWTAGKRLGGRASLDELYRLFAWSFLPAAFAALLYALILTALTKPSTVTSIIASVPSLVIFCSAIRNYCSNIIAVQQFTRTRGIASVVLTLILFLILIAGGIVFLSLILGHGPDECLKSIFTT